MDRPRLLVIGATGALGRPLVHSLLERGIAVRAACRHPEQAADLADRGAEVVAADLIDRASLQRACAGVERLVMAAHGILGRGRWRSEAVDGAGLASLIEVARDAGVQRIVYCSALEASADHPVDFFRTKFQGEQALRASGLPHAVLRPSAFMEQHVHLFNGLGLLSKGRVELIGPGSKPRNFVAATDVARFAQRALLDDPLPFATLDIGGHDHASNAEVAALYARLSGLPLKTRHLPRPAATLIAALAGPFNPGLARIMRIFALPDDAFEERFEGAADLEARFGLRLTRLQDFVAAQVQAWRANADGRRAG